MIKWDDSYNIGIETIDEQHKYLFKLCRDLEILLATPNVIYKVDDAIKIVCDFRNYVTYHFYYEEMYFGMVHYAYLADHIADHKAFKKQILDINVSNFYKENYDELQTLINFLYGWIFDHITKKDITLKTLVE
ncbi:MULTISPECIES: hemerythrin domain-containing protein [Clostridium]|uniref:Hemerythrin domain-containing protein n=1 Tax=Clostridium aquiflavi TaxID=3073603 RepID=A0ABU1EIX0_9CLOT|nr:MULTISPECIES: hemerythrin domain-containing protein [unclassified Clostridium]MDR5587889.1 hemerythrin domain-containing protein [Clostridium sp. 5N-1]NFG63374.1 hemerythrin-binding protein [Clostridium botulinum]NFQ11109.1 hemerythrin-binding protein [Clostridium botulinum]